MKLKDIEDMEDYLENRCYCPYEIYDLSGFFYRLFYPDMDCIILASGIRGSVHGSFVVVDNQIIYIEITNNKVNNCIRIDATENNKLNILEFMAGKIKKLKFDEFEEGATKKALEDIFKYTDAILYE